MISKKVWNDWLEGFEEYRKTHYPIIKVSEKDIIDIMFKSFRTIYMEQLIIDINEERKP